MAGKWAHLKNKFTRYTAEKTWQDRVDKMKDLLRSLMREARQEPNLVNLGKVLRKLNTEKDGLEEQVKVLNTKIEAVQQLMVDEFEESEMTSFKVDDGGSFILSDTPYVSIDDRNKQGEKDEELKKRNQKKFYTWLKKNGLESMFTVNWQSMSAMVKARLEEDQSIPPGIKVFMKASVSYRGPAKPKAPAADAAKGGSL